MKIVSKSVVCAQVAKACTCSLLASANICALRQRFNTAAFTAPVSYTHLDVYKRQSECSVKVDEESFASFVIVDGEGKIESDDTMPVSYTHLDVYKRQL